MSVSFGSETVTDRRHQGEPGRFRLEVPFSPLRAHAIDRYGHEGRQAPSEPLVAIYRSDTNPEIRKQVIHALYMKRDAEALVSVARQETDAALKKEAVRNLSKMKSKVATDFLLEILNQ